MAVVAVSRSLHFLMSRLNPLIDTLSIGDRFGRLVITNLRPAPELPWHVAVACDCGVHKLVRIYELGKDSRSCGCLQRAVASAMGHAKQGRPRNRPYDPQWKCNTGIAEWQHDQLSIGASIFERIGAELQRQAEQRRQTSIDGIDMQSKIAAVQRAEQLARRQDEIDARQAREDEQRQADRLASIHGPSADLSPEIGRSY